MGSCRKASLHQQRGQPRPPQEKAHEICVSLRTPGGSPEGIELHPEGVGPSCPQQGLQLPLSGKASTIQRRKNSRVISKELKVHNQAPGVRSITVFLSTDPFSVQLVCCLRMPHSSGRWRRKSSLPAAAGQAACRIQVDTFLVERCHVGCHSLIEVLEPSRARGSSSPRYAHKGVRQLPSPKQSHLLLRGAQEPWATEAKWEGIPFQEMPPKSLPGGNPPT